MDAQRLTLTLGLGLFCSLGAPGLAQAAPEYPRPLSPEEAFDEPILFMPVFGDLEALAAFESGEGFDEPILFLDIYAGYAVVETASGDDQVSFDEPILFVPLHGSPKAMGWNEGEPGTGMPLLSLPLQIDPNGIQIENGEDEVGFDVPLAGFDVPLAGFDVPLAGAPLPEAVAEEVFDAPLVFIPLVSSPEAYEAAVEEGAGYEPTYLLPIEPPADIEAPPLLLPVI